MNKSNVSGKFDQLKGKVKQGVGEAVGDDRMANSGTADQVKGNAKEAWGDTKDAARSTSRDATSGSNQRTGDTAHNVRNKVVAMAENAKDAVTGRGNNPNRKRSA